MSSTRSLVLQSFKKLHRTRIKVFAGDEKALTAGRLKINEEYKKNKNVTNEDSIKTAERHLRGFYWMMILWDWYLEMVKFAEDVNMELKTQVIQAREVKPGVYEVRITDEIVKFDNIPYNDNAILEDGNINKPCCQDRQPNK